MTSCSTTPANLLNFWQDTSLEIRNLHVHVIVLFQVGIERRQREREGAFQWRRILVLLFPRVSSKRKGNCQVRHRYASGSQLRVATPDQLQGQGRPSETEKSRN